jgi:PAS domain S-box-containing protein
MGADGSDRTGQDTGPPLAGWPRQALAADVPVRFEELFQLADLQRIQDEFAAATGVASIITHPDGTPITRPSRFTRLCSDVVRGTAAGCAACFRSDAVLGRPNPSGPIVRLCLSGGLWDAGASITVGGRHIANWLIGQVRDETQTEQAMRDYARTIGADEEALLAAFREVPSMSREQFGHVAQALFSLASQLSTAAYQNHQLARFIEAKEQAEAALERSERSYREIFDSMEEAIFLHDLVTGLVVDVNAAMLRLYGYASKAEALEQVNHAHAFGQTAAGGEAYGRLRKAATEGPQVFEWRARRSSGEEFWVEVSLRSSQIGGQGRILAVVRDIGQRKRTEAALAESRAQLARVQKMESIGRLAGGVAHDVNNMAQAILSNVTLALEALAPDDALRESLEEIRSCAHRSADMTRQLLGFARKQAVAPQVLDLAATVEGMLRVLRRLIGENVLLAWSPSPGLWPVRMDPSQLDQLLANLCVNARDAIRGHGTIAIEAANVTLDAAHCAAHAGAAPGDHVCLTVRDDGSGMSREILEHIFEPFFTTKETLGTGLGLATVYGIVQQNAGSIEVESVPGLGSTFRVYLPRHAGEAPAARLEPATAAPPQGTGTILLVEDEPAILRTGKRLLETLGYGVIAAGSPVEALALAAAHPGPIRLLLTDVVMPGMNGQELARRLTAARPEARCLFMSGYAADVLARQGVLDPGVRLVQKPFEYEELAAKVREALAGPG